MRFKSVEDMVKKLSKNKFYKRWVRNRGRIIIENYQFDPVTCRCSYLDKLILNGLGFKLILDKKDNYDSYTKLLLHCEGNDDCLHIIQEGKPTEKYAVYAHFQNRFMRRK